MVIYSNAAIDKAQILSDNQNKAGIYCFHNLITGKKYIGSGTNLSKRLAFYFSASSLETQLKRGQSHICSAILKHGLENFSLEILGYCDKKDLMDREGYYLNLLWEANIPRYNLSKDPTALMFGRKHSPETIKKMSDAKLGENHPRFGKNHSDETRKKISDANKGLKAGENHPRFGKPRPVGAGSPSQVLEVFDVNNNTTTQYDSISAAARALEINESSINTYFSRNQQKPHKNIYFQKSRLIYFFLFREGKT